jgi:hypothetical protein
MNALEYLSNVTKQIIEKRKTKQEVNVYLCIFFIFTKNRNKLNKFKLKKTKDKRRLYSTHD